MLPLNIAHRGASSAAPENTIPAFKKAIEFGAEALELDVHLTKDNHVVVIHDVSVDRTTDSRGYVWNYTLEEIKQMNTGVGDFKEFKGTRIPTLEEVFEFVKPYDVKVYIEIKTPIYYNYQGIENKIVNLINRYKYENRAVVASFAGESVKIVKNIDCNIKTGLNFHYPGADIVNTIKRFGADEIGVSYKYVNYIGKKSVKKIKNKGFKINVFTVNREKFMRKMIKLKVDGIITDCPNKLKALKDSMSKSYVKRAVKMIV